MSFQIIQKQLQGVVKLIPTTSAIDCYFVVPTNGVSPQNTNISNLVLQDVFILTDQSDYSIRIFLPKISSFNGQWNSKLFITAIDSFSVDVIPYSDIDEVNTINTLSNIQVKGAFLQIGSENNWLCFSAY
jgi:hypothetical protein